MEELTAPLPPHAAQNFVEKYATASSEKQLGQSFWRDFFTSVCGVTDLLASGIEFEFPVRSATTDTIGFIDVLWPSVLLIEHKSAGQDLDKAEKQARDYLISLEVAKRPPVIIICDFQRWRLIEVLAGTSVEFVLADLPEHLPRIETILGGRGRGAARVEEVADAQAAKLMSDLFVAFENAGYGGHEVSVFLVRMLFLLFGDDTRMWRRAGELGLFEALVDETPTSGTGLGGILQELFQVLNTMRDDRPKTLPASIADFPYVNGGLFSETLPIFSFTPEMRTALGAACRYNWSSINPSIFGAMFQNIKSKDARRELGQHYTSEANILKVIGPLFLDEMNERLRKEWDSPAGLRRFQKELPTYTWADPACGCGNFLLVAYKRVRDLELRIAARLLELEGQHSVALDGTWLLTVSLSQFWGIEYDNWSSEIAKVAMFLAEHQANIAMERLLGQAPSLLPLHDAANIIHGNALRMGWDKLWPMTERTFIMGNPPFYGSSLQNAEQREDTALVWGADTGAGVLDYVTNWFHKAAEMCQRNGVRTAFVATNSISQGEQPPVLWGRLYGMGVGIDFAHRPFRWSNDAKGQAAVHTVIIGFSTGSKASKRPLWDYSTPVSEPVLVEARNINAYLLDAPDVLITSRRTPLVPNTQPLDYGSKPTDGGFLSDISSEEAATIRSKDALAAKYLRRIVGARELLHNDERWCLWLHAADLNDLRTSLELRTRVAAVEDYRSKSGKAKTREDAKRAWEFQEIRQPKSPYIAVPQHTSEGRDYLAVAYFGSEVVVNNAVSIIKDATMTTFGVLSSRAFWLWAKAISGRLKSDIRISGSVTYNNFPFPELSDAQRAEVEDAARNVLHSRTFFMENSLADLYDPRTMPVQLRAAHNELDKAVAKVFGLPASASDEKVLARLFDLYQEMTSGLLPSPPSSARRRRAA